MLCVSSVYLRDIANNFCNLALECVLSECLLFLFLCFVLLFLLVSFCVVFVLLGFFLNFFYCCCCWGEEEGFFPCCKIRFCDTLFSPCFFFFFNVCLLSLDYCCSLVGDDGG